MYFTNLQHDLTRFSNKILIKRCPPHFLIKSIAPVSNYFLSCPQIIRTTVLVDWISMRLFKPIFEYYFLKKLSLNPLINQSLITLVNDRLKHLAKQESLKSLTSERIPLNTVLKLLGILLKVKYQPQALVLNHYLVSFNFFCIQIFGINLYYVSLKNVFWHLTGCEAFTIHQMISANSLTILIEATYLKLLSLVRKTNVL